MKTKKRNKKNKKILIILLSLFIFIIAILLLILPLNKKINTKNPIVGSWTTDNVTIYRFNEDNTGVLKVSLSDYKFNYTIDEKNLFIDIENEKSEDINYTYSIKDNELKLKGKNGTFKFKKIID